MSTQNGKVKEVPTIGKGPELVERRDFKEVGNIAICLGMTDDRANEIIEYADALTDVHDNFLDIMFSVIDEVNLNPTEKVFTMHCCQQIIKAHSNPFATIMAMMADSE